MTPQEIAQVIWNIKEIIRDDYQDKDVDQVILPFTLLRRLDCVFEGYEEKVQQIMSQVPEHMRDAHLPKIFKARTGLSFYNTSGLSLKKIISNPAAIGDNFKTYLEGFSPNIKDILYNFTGGEENGLKPIYATLDRKGLLYKVTQRFVQDADLSPESVDNHMMGTVFETIIRYTKETTAATAGQYYTPREIVRLLVGLVMTGQEDKIYTEGQNFSIYDPCCGTGGMLTVAKDYLISKTDRPMIVSLCGQELNEQTYAICKSDILMKGDDASEIKQGNTLDNDQNQGKTFNFMIANPPFGMDWKKSEEFIRNEAETPGSRFAPGLPSTSDGSLLFLLHMIHKMDPNGARIGIVLNGSPLFNGGAGSGWSDIRRYILDQNLLDTIVALPGDIFYGTPIASYLWILDNKRPEERRNKVLFINAVHDIFSRPMQRSLGNKRVEMSENGIEDILCIYKNYRNAHRIINPETAEEVEVAKLLDYDDFRYTQVTVQRPLRLFYNDVCNLIVHWKSENAISKGDMALYEAILNNYDDTEQHNDDEFFKEAQTILKRKNLPQSTINKLRKLAVTDENAPIAYIKPGDKESGPAPDPALKDTESIPFKRDIDEFFETEVLKFVPDAWLDRTQDKLGVEFPLTRIFYKFKPSRSTVEILKDILSIDKKTDQDVLKLMNEEV